jgi:hypothetical protein
VTPEPFEIIVFARLFREDVHQKIAVIHEDPFGVLVALDAERTFTDSDEVLPDGIADGLDLTGIRSVADDEAVGEGSDLAEVQNANILSFLRCRGVGSGDPSLLGILNIYTVFGQYAGLLPS